MSKFFKALEKVEQERGTAERVEPRTVAEPPVAPPPAVVAASAAVAKPVNKPVAPAAPAPTATDGRPAPVVLPFAKPPESKPVEPRSTVYGAPIAREAGGSRFTPSALDVEPLTDEPGELDDHLVSLLQPTSFAAEQYRAVRFAIETFRHERGTRVVGISSPGRGDGKTMTAINLAGALAQAPDARVALLEVDFRHPAVAKYLGLPMSRGLSAYLLDPATELDRIVQRPAGITFAVVPAGAVSSMVYELLKSPRLSALFAELRQRFDFVVVDAPPALPYPDVGILRDLVDGVVLVVRANRTPRELLRDATNVVGRQRALGMVFNDAEGDGVASFEDEAEGGWRRYVPRPLGGARVA